LDGKHTIFGKLVGGMAVLDKMESVPAGDNDCPTHEIIINEAVVFVDPFAAKSVKLANVETNLK
jgi:peptidyl-prolyl cis-trans isomerase-like protein 2